MGQLKIECIYNYMEQGFDQKLNRFLNSLEQNYNGEINNIKSEWNRLAGRMDFKFKLCKYDIQGDIQFNNKGILVNVRVPVLAKSLEKTLEDNIEKKLKEL